MNLFRNIGGSGGIAMITTIMARRQQFHQEVLVSHLTPLDGDVLPTLSGMTANLVAHGASSADAAVQAVGQLYGLVQRQAAMLAVADTFWVLSLVFLGMIPLVLCLKAAPPHKGPMIME
jgi:DHA2 family multidrug resistance protein